jgi:hypothetical protein
MASVEIAEAREGQGRIFLLGWVHFDFVGLPFDLLDVNPKYFNLFLESNQVSEKAEVVLSKVHAARV